MNRRFGLSLLALTLAFGCSSAPEEPAAPPEVSFEQHEDRIDVFLQGEEFTTLYLTPEGPTPHFHPLRAADGTIVTRQYPMVKDVPGESDDHIHHRGLWFAHDEVNGVNFWANGPDRPKRGDIVLKSVGEVGGDSLSAEFEWQAQDGSPLLTESRTVRFAQDGDIRTLDFNLTLTASAEEPVRIGDTKEGTFAVRVAPGLRARAVEGGPGTGVMLNADGAQGEENIWGKPSDWVDFSGPIGDQTYGVAIFDHPSNPKHPTYWHARAYGLLAANVFGEHHFFDDPERDGSMTFDPGEQVRFRYLVVVHSGSAATANIGRLYSSWSQ